jgi:hypothetical protein
MYQTPTSSASLLKLILISILFSFLYAGLAFFAGALFGLFAMGCGGSCSTSSFPLKVLIISIVIFLVLISFHFIWLKKIYAVFTVKIILWIVLSLILVLLTGPVIAKVVLYSGNKQAEKTVGEIYSPFIKAQSFHPRITFKESEKIRDPATGELTEIKVTALVESKVSAKLTLVGGLYEKIQDSEWVANVPEHYDEIFVNASNTPTEITFSVKHNKENKYAMPLENYNIFGVYATFGGETGLRVEPGPNEFPVDDVDDSGKSGEALLTDNDDRTVFYKLN